MPKGKVIYWILSVVAALLFGFAGFSKVSANPMMVQSFSHFGYAIWFMYFIGAAEIVGALGLVFGHLIDVRLSRVAVIGLLIIMVGAIASHLMYDPLPAMIPAVVLSLMLLGILYIHEDSHIA